MTDLNDENQWAVFYDYLGTKPRAAHAPTKVFLANGNRAAELTRRAIPDVLWRQALAPPSPSSASAQAPPDCGRRPWPGRAPRRRASMSLSSDVAPRCAATPMLTVRSTDASPPRIGRAATARRTRSASTAAWSVRLPGERNHEFFAAEPADDVAASQLLRHGLGDGPKRKIADRMAPSVVDGLEVIEVEHEQRRRRPVAGRREAACAPLPPQSRGG